MSIRTTYEKTYDSVILINKIISDLVGGKSEENISAVSRNVDHIKIKLNDPLNDFTEQEKVILQKGISDGEAWL